MALQLDFGAPVEETPRKLHLDFDNFEPIFQRTLDLEGGFVEDEGGPTNLGITQTLLNNFNKQRGLPSEDVRDLQIPKVRQVFKEEFFERPKFNLLPENVGSLQFDFGVQSSPKRATKSLQKIVGTEQDGKVGPKTIKATIDFIDKEGEKNLLQKLIDDREQFLKTTPAFKRVPRGLMNRIQKIKNEFDLSSLNPFAVGEAEADVPGQLDFSDPEEKKEPEFVKAGEEQLERNIETQLQQGAQQILGQPILPEDKVFGELNEQTPDIKPEDIIPTVERGSRDQITEDFLSIELPTFTAGFKNEQGQNIDILGNVIDVNRKGKVVKIPLARPVKDALNKYIDWTNTDIGRQLTDENSSFNQNLEFVAALGLLTAIGASGINEIVRSPLGQSAISKLANSNIWQRIFTKPVNSGQINAIFNKVQAGQKIPLTKEESTIWNALKSFGGITQASKRGIRIPRFGFGEPTQERILALPGPQGVGGKIINFFSGVPAPFKGGDLVRMGDQVFRFLQTTGQTATLASIAGETVTVNLSELQHLDKKELADALKLFPTKELKDQLAEAELEVKAPEKPVEARPPTEKEVIKPIPKVKEGVISPGKVKPIIGKVTGLKPETKPLTSTEKKQLKFRLQQQAKASKPAFKAGKDFEKAQATQKAAVKAVNEMEDTQRKIDAALVVEELSQDNFETESNALNEHMDYFQSRQLPPGSQVKSIQKSIRTIGRLKQSGKIKPTQANRITKRLRKNLMSQAKKEGIAIRMTKGGKIMLSVRESGVFVPERFAEWKKFKDLGAVAGGGTDITRAIQSMDGSLTIKEKVNTPEQAGPLERNVLWPTRDMTLQKLAYVREKTALLKKILQGVKKDSKQDIAINDVTRELRSEDLNLPVKELMARENIKAITTSQVDVEKAVALRKFYDDAIDEQNAARDMRNQENIKFRQNYTPEILRDATMWERLQNVGADPKKVTEGPTLPDYIQPNKPFNPREKAREFGIKYEDRVKSATDLAESYIATSAKDIFNTSIIQNNKAFIQQLETMGLNKSANVLADWTSEAYGGLQPKLDRAVSLPQGWQGGLRLFNRLRNMAVFPLNFAWNVFTQTSSLALTVGRFGVINTIKGLVSYARPSVRDRLSKEYYSFIVKAFKQGKMTRQDVKNLLGEDIKIYKSPTDIIEDATNIVGDQLERLLTGASIEAGRLQGIKRGLKGEALKQFASDAGAKTQSMYNDEDKPGVLRNLTVKTLTPYQTFAFEVQNTLREWIGKTGLPPDTQMERIFIILRFLAATIAFGAMAKKAGRTVWDWTRPALPFAEMWLSPIIAKIQGEYFDPKRALPAPVQAVLKITAGIKDVLDRGDWRKLRRELIFWGPGLLNIPAGLSMSRIVDSIIAYSQGGIYDKSGKPLFRVDNELDLLWGMFAGVWATRGGQEYLKKHKGKGLFSGDKIDIKQILENVGGLAPKERRIEARKRRLRKRKRKRERKRLIF